MIMKQQEGGHLLWATFPNPHGISLSPDTHSFLSLDDIPFLVLVHGQHK
jgi:hypothetical protein